MNKEELTEVKNEVCESVERNLSKKYFLIPRNGWWAFVGGALAFAVGVGAISYQTALKAVADPNVRKAIDNIYDSEKAAKTAAASIEVELKKSTLVDSRISKLEAETLRNGNKVRLTQPARGGFGVPGTVVLTGGNPVITTTEKQPQAEQNWTITRK